MIDMIKDLAGDLKDNAALANEDFWNNAMEKSFNFIEKIILPSDDE